MGLSESEFPPVPTTAEAMAVRWAARDAEYAKERKPMSPERVDIIRMMRMLEASRLPDVTERGRMYARAKSWAPPVHQDFGSLRDWVE